MPLDSDRWGTAVAAAVVAEDVQAGVPITTAKLETIWKAICAEHVTELANAQVAPGTFIDSLAAPVTGIGGPIS